MEQEFERTGQAMGTDYSISIVCDSPTTANELFTIAELMIRDYERRFSRFLSESEVTQLNKYKTMTVSPELLHATKKAYELFELTKGVFNPLVQVSKLGYIKNFDDLQESDVPDDEAYNIDFSLTLIDATTSRITLHSGQKLDFGGFLKGYLAELIAKKLKAAAPEIKGVIVNLGGDIHTQGVDQYGKYFIFTIYNPVTDTEELAIPLHNQSLATSGTYKRRWVRSGAIHHHILDASGARNPTTDIVSASAIHSDGATSEAYAKVLLSLGPDRAQELLTQKSVSWIVIRSNGDIAKHAI